eukprot:g369.t1
MGNVRVAMTATYLFRLLLLSISLQRATSTKAFYILFSNQVMDNPEWPTKLCQNNGHGPQGAECVDATQYANGIFIASPQNMTKDIITKIKKDVSNSKVLAYFDFGDIPLAYDPKECPFCHSHIMGDKPGRNCTTTYACGPSSFLANLQGIFLKKFAVHDITKGLPGVMVESYPGLAKYVWNSKSTPLLANFLSSWVIDNGFDGIYLDGYVQPNKVNFEQCELKEEGCQSFLKANHTYDIDGDGLPDSSIEIYGSYFAWAPAFVALMRQKLGAERIILANSAGSISDSSLSGITIEMEACNGVEGPQKCSDALNAQKLVTAAVDKKTPASILWLTHSNTIPAPMQCKLLKKLQDEYPWVQAGTDFFDGSHVTC